MGTGSVVARPWLRRGIVIAIIASLALAAAQLQLAPSASATHLDGTEFAYTKNIRFAVRKKGHSDVWFRFKLPLLGTGIRFGGLGAGTFELINAGIDDDGVGTGDTPHLRGTYGPKPHANGEVDAQDHKDVLEFDQDSLEDIANKIALALEGKLEIKRDAQCFVDLDYKDLLDLPALNVAEDAEGRVIMDLPALRLVGPAECPPKFWDVSARSGATRTKGEELPATGPSSSSTATKGLVVAAVSVAALGVMRRRRSETDLGTERLNG